MSCSGSASTCATTAARTITTALPTTATARLCATAEKTFDLSGAISRSTLGDLPRGRPVQQQIGNNSTTTTRRATSRLREAGGGELLLAQITRAHHSVLETELRVRRGEHRHLIRACEIAPRYVAEICRRDMSPRSPPRWRIFVVASPFVHNLYTRTGFVCPMR